jgi:cation-transporting P-type ATPase E
MQITADDISKIKSTDELTGLTEEEAILRRKNGQGNDITIDTGRTYADILRQNMFTFINIIIFIIGVLMIIMNLWGDAFVSVGVILMNVVVGVVQEFRAKYKLDRIALLTRPQVTVIRDNQERIVDPAVIVLGDIIIASPGDQFVVDGIVVGGGKMEIDESLLTGESDLIPKRAGDEVLSGSFCVTGTASYEATKVGANSFANKLTAKAKKFRVITTPLQQDINLVVRILTFTAAVIGILFGVSFVIHDVPTDEVVQSAAVIAGLVPAGLILLTATSYAMGALRMSGRGALIQQANAVESMSNVDILCMDKTGTLTANRINLHQLAALTVSEDEFERILGDYAHSTPSGNRTTDALIAGCSGQQIQLIDEIPFSSARKWSALSIEQQGVYVLGAPEMLMHHLPQNTDINQNQIDQWTSGGLRVLLMLHSPQVISLHDEQDRPYLPDDLLPLGIISFSDELRDEVQNTIASFRKAEIELKIISGDHPETVAALARQAGFPADIKVVNGPDLQSIGDTQLIQIAEETTVFGRITPEQKERLVEILRAQGHYVAMIGDGVNDVLSLKKAQIGIAMQSGSAATRGVADIVLLNDSFAALPAAFMEGQRIINGMADIIRLFMARAFFAAFIIVGTSIIAGVHLFPFVPKHASLLTLITIGIPTLFMAAWARPGLPNYNLNRSMIHFVFPAALTLAATVLAVYAIFLRDYWTLTDVEEAAQCLKVARTALTTAIIFMGLFLLPFVQPPTRFWAGGNDFSGDTRPTIMAIIMLMTYAALIAYEPLRIFFELEKLQLGDYLFIAAVSIIWAILLRFIWRANLFERLIGISIEPKA